MIFMTSKSQMQMMPQRKINLMLKEPLTKQIRKKKRRKKMIKRKRRRRMRIRKKKRRKMRRRRKMIRKKLMRDLRKHWKISLQNLK